MHIGCVYSVSNFSSKNKPLASQELIPFGISLIATVLKDHNYEPHIIVFTPRMNIKKIVQEFIDKYHPVLFCLTATSSQFELMKIVATEIKRIDNNIFTVLGGAHASLNPEETIQYGDFDALCVGEGEKAILELAHYLEMQKKPGSIPNLWIKNTESGFIEKNPRENFIEDLDSLPFLDRTLWYNWIDDLDLRPSVLIGRGCPNKCTFCSNHALSKVTTGTYVRFRSPENIVKEITEMVKKNPNIHSIYLEIETLSVNVPYAYDLFTSLEKFNENRGIPIEFGVNVSPVKKIIENEDFFIRLKRANFTSINIGLESGSERVRKEILRRPSYKNDDIVNFCKLARKYNIKVMLNLLVGIPGETKKEYYETIACARKCEPNSIQMSIFEPYPGTDLYTFCIEHGLFSPENREILKSNRSRAYMDLPGFSKFAIQREYYLFSYRVWGFRTPLNFVDVGLIYIKIISDAIFGQYSIFQLKQKIRDNRIGKMQLSDFE
ncbi:MAG: radical SAM protein [Methanoregula sp.]